MATINRDIELIVGKYKTKFFKNEEILISDINKYKNKYCLSVSNIPKTEKPPRYQYIHFDTLEQAEKSKKKLEEMYSDKSTVQLIKFVGYE